MANFRYFSDGENKNLFYATSGSAGFDIKADLKDTDTDFYFSKMKYIDKMNCENQNQKEAFVYVSDNDLIFYSFDDVNDLSNNFPIVPVNLKPSDLCISIKSENLIKEFETGIFNRIKTIKEMYNYSKRKYFYQGDFEVISVQLVKALKVSNDKSTLIPTRLFVSFDSNYELQLRSRSGISTKRNVIVVNGVGTVDSDYRGEVKVPLISLTDNDFYVYHGMRVAQGILSPIIKADFKLENSVEHLGSTDRGSGGFGSSGL